jgi:DNA-directed RNA polymerase subunit RPC12/RpoP
MIARSFQPRHAAYRNVKSKKVEIDGIKFASPGEAERYLELCIMKLQGKITEIVLQPEFELQPAFRKCHACGGLFTEKDTPSVYKKGKCPVCNVRIFITRDIRYIADFKVTYSDGEEVIEDVKGWGGYTTPDFKLKHKMFEFKYPALSLVLLKRAGKVKVREALLAERERLK